MKPRLKIFHIITRLNVGGAALYNILLADGLADLGHEVWLVYGTVESSESEMFDYMDRKEYRFVKRYIPELMREIRLGKDLIAFWKLFVLIAHERPDVIHTHTSKAGLLGRLAAWLLRVPVKIHSYHGTVFQGYFGGLASRAIGSFEKFLGQRCEAIFADTETVVKQATSRGVVPSDRAFSMPLGLELEPFADLAGFRGRLRRHLGIGKSTPLVGIVARLTQIKDVETFLRSVPAILKAHPETHIASVGNGELRMQLEEEARRMGIAERVHFLGFWRELREIYADIDLLALSSLSEGCPVAILEAMASGLAVVSTSVGGVPDVVRDGKKP
ncbi:MAG: glycosyltransferase [Deltaproteobacteria bacterium]|nr:glycosyltransferase [Deltaproteobacteria bacterium]